MNKQGKLINGKVIGGIEWTKTVYPDGTESPGFTWNPVQGCRHACRWVMPDGTIAVCYAEDVAKKFKDDKFFPEGFEKHYWNPDRLEEPLRQKKPAKIFLDSMSDLMGHWVPQGEIAQVLSVCVEAHWHIFQLLTKNAPRLIEFEFPKNVWVGVSCPPSIMFGKPLSSEQQEHMVIRQLAFLEQVNVPVRWMSIEPLAFDIAEVFDRWMITYGKLPLEWAVVGAASNGPKLYQPDPKFVEKVHDRLRTNGVKIFHKGNLKWDPHLEEFPSLSAAKSECSGPRRTR